MRASNSARPLRSPFRPGGIAHPLDREDVTLSLVELEPEPEDDFSLDELSILEDEDDEVVASCARLSQIIPVTDDLEIEVEFDDAGWDEDVWVDVSDLNAASAPNPFLVEEPSTFGSGAPANSFEAAAADTLDPPTVDIDWLLVEEPSPSRQPRRPSPEDTKTLVLRRSWICMPPGNTNADLEEPTGLNVAQLLQLVRGQVTESPPPEARSPMPSLPRFPILPPDPRSNPVHIPALRLPRFDVD